MKTRAGAMPKARIADETAGTDMLYSSGTTGRPKGVRVALPNAPIDAPSPLTMLASMLFGINKDRSISRPRRSITQRPCAIAWRSIGSAAR